VSARRTDAGAPLPPNLPSTRRVLVAVAASLAAIFLVAGVISSVAGLPEIAWDVRPGWIVLSFGLFFGAQLSHAELWRRVLRDAGGRVGPLPAQSIFAASLLTRYVPTQILMVVTRVGMSERESVPRSVALTSIVYEFALVVGTSIALSLGFLFSLERLEGSPLRFALLLAPVAILALLHPWVIDLLSNRLAPRLGARSAHRTIPVGRLLLYVAGYAASFAIFGLATAAFAHGIRPLDELTFSVLTAYAVAYASSVLAFLVPGGLGAREAAMASALTTAMPFSVALAAAIGVRVVQTVVELVTAGGTAWLVRRSRRGG